MKKIMLRILIGVSLLVSCQLQLLAQKKQISQARDYIKSGKELEKAEKMMSVLLKDSANINNHKIWLTLLNAVKGQYEQGNEKLYLRQKYDTAAFFESTLKMFRISESFDSIESKPDRKGRVRLKYRKENAEYLSGMRRNLYNGGMFFVKRSDYGKAYEFYNKYIDCIYQPLFKEYGYDKTDELLSNAAYWTMYCGSKMKDPAMTLKNIEMAMKDSERVNYVLQYQANALLQLGDTSGYIGCLKKGFDKYPDFPFFFPRLFEYYAKHEMLDSAMIVSDKAISIDSTNVVFRLAKSTVLLNMGRYDECIDICMSIVSKNDSIADVYYNIGLAYFNQAIALDKEEQRKRSKQALIKKLYQKSLPHMEKYRKLAPNLKNKWGAVLYTIYLNLNMGREFDEIEKEIKE